jgi:uncharacterized protein (DUF58 family)
MDRILEKIGQVDYFIDWYTLNHGPGVWNSRHIGPGYEFEKISEYLVGDDTKTINWRATARTGGMVTLKNTYLDLKNITIYVLADVSNSMNFGTTRTSKKYLAAEIAAILTYSGVRFGDEVGLITWPEVHMLRARAMPGMFVYIAEEILQIETTRSTASLRDALAYLPNKRCLVFVLSDYISDSDLYGDLEYASKRHDLIPILIEDPLEIAFPNRFCFVRIKDLETSRAKETLHTRGTLRKFKDRVKEEREKAFQVFDTLNVAYLMIQDGYSLEDLAGFFIDKRTHH